MSRTGILFIHGLMGSPREFVPVAKQLGSEGFLTHVVTLPGHGPEPQRAFHEASSEELFDHCLEEYHALAKHVDEMYIVGHSLGGICTLMTAAEQPRRLKGAVAFSTPFEHAYLYNNFSGLLSLTVPHFIKSVTYVPELATGFERPTFPKHKLPKLRQEAIRTLQLLPERVPQINVPLCLAHSRYDLTIPYGEMSKIAATVNAPVVTHTLEQSGHQIFPYSRDYERAVEIIHTFVSVECEQLSGEALIQAG